MTKAEIRKWTKRMREDIGMIHTELARPGLYDPAVIFDLAMDISGAAAELIEATEAPGFPA